jgi:hypothetical protein
MSKKDTGIYRGGMHDEDKEPIMHFIGNTFEEDLEIHYSVKEMCKEAEANCKKYFDYIDNLGKDLDDGIV